MSTLSEGLLEAKHDSAGVDGDDRQLGCKKAAAQDHGEYTASSKRWFIIMIYCLLNIANSMMWCTFSPISDLTTDFFQHIGPGNTAVNMFTVVYYILYLPATILGAIVVKRYDIRGGLLIAGAVTSVGALLRSIGTFCSFVYMILTLISRYINLLCSCV